MFTCRACRSTKIKTRSNSTSGKKSSTIALFCKSCGSKEISYTDAKKNFSRRPLPRRDADVKK
jgi:transcription elongation factor Elf1